ncbi:hypothetical protein MASR1M60_00550 [Rhodocyclaceae bacterium]
MTQWQLMPGIDPAAAACFADLDKVFTLEGDIVARDAMSNVVRVAVNSRHYYVKRYAGLGDKPLRRWLVTPRIQLEWENLQRFAAWGIPTADLVAYGLEKKQGRFFRGAMITAEIPDTQDLRRLARNADPRLKSRRWWDGVSRQLADITRRMHAQRFAHGDLKWRNLLVDKEDRLFLIDCPSGGFWRPPFLEYRIVKDLACLDKSAKRNLSRSRRLRFYLDYVGKRRLDKRDKQRIRKIVGFFVGRDEDLASAASLRAAGRTPLPRQSIALESGALLTLKRWLRVLPGKRLTGVGEWQGRPVLAKLFIAARGAERHWQRECRGVEVLQTSALPSPALLLSGKLEGGGYFVLFEFLDNARLPDPGARDELAMVFAQVGRMHTLGLVQQDAHLGNFLLQDDRLLVIDGAAIRPGALDEACTDNLALLLAQLPPDREAVLRSDLIAAYRSSRPDGVLDERSLAAAILRHRQARLDDYLDKCLRDCSLFKVAQRADRFSAVWRAEAKRLAPLLHDPDAWLAQGTPLKHGNTATLARIEVNGRPLVIKRYNIKSARHALSRCWRPSRAWHAWREGHRLSFLGIPTPLPLALIERRLGPLRGTAWLITEYCSGENLARHLQPCLDAPPPRELDVLGELFAQLTAQRIVHGDLKATNLLWHDDRIALIDLDATRQHRNDTAFRKAWEKDRARLLRNWPADSVLYAALSKVLPT